MTEPCSLKPCPFCGGEANYTESVNGSNMVFAGCNSCGIEYRAKHGGKDVIALWQTRTAQMEVEWKLITEGDYPPLDVPVHMCWIDWPEGSTTWVYETGLYGSKRGGWRHREAQYYKMPVPPKAALQPAASEG